jgi:hypothetical protein
VVGVTLALVLTVAIGGAIYAGVIWLVVLHRMRRTNPDWLIPQLRKHNGELTVTVRRSLGAWNPARPSRAGLIFESGIATYRLDREGFVHLDLQPKRGQVRHFSGPLPVPASTGSVGVRKYRRRTRWILLAFGMSLTICFAVGHPLSGGGRQPSRLGWGLLGLGIAWILVWLATLLNRIYFSIRGISRQGADAAP